MANKWTMCQSKRQSDKSAKGGNPSIGSLVFLYFHNRNLRNNTVCSICYFEKVGHISSPCRLVYSPAVVAAYNIPEKN